MQRRRPRRVHDRTGDTSAYRRCVTDRDDLSTAYAHFALELFEHHRLVQVLDEVIDWACGRPPAKTTLELDDLLVVALDHDEVELGSDSDVRELGGHRMATDRLLFAAVALRTWAEEIATGRRPRGLRRRHREALALQQVDPVEVFEEVDRIAQDPPSRVV